jgi:ribosomal protein L11 methyltransferase
VAASEAAGTRRRTPASHGKAIPGQWLELAVEAGPEAAEALYAIFHRWGHGGVAVEVPHLPPALDEQTWAAAPDPLPGTAVVIKTYVPVGPALESCRQGLEQDLWHLQAFGLGAIGPLQTRIVAEQDWAEAWKAHYQVQRIGSHFVIKPSWREYRPQPGDVVLELDPGMAFGTGLHPSTQLCLLALEHHPPAGALVLDLGTGSGILALGAARLGARQVVALDLDPVAVDAATANVRRNGLDGVITVAEGTLDYTGTPRLTPGGSAGIRSGPFDVVLANIVASVIIELAPGLAAACRRGGLLVASGILEDRLPQVQQALDAHGFTSLGVTRSADWVAVTAGRR